MNFYSLSWNLCCLFLFRYSYQGKGKD